VFGLHNETNVFYQLISFIMYMLVSVGFASLCVMLVKVFAPYACGSGIPEVRPDVHS
jgi:chloride channel 3/4/5